MAKNLDSDEKLANENKLSQKKNMEDIKEGTWQKNLENGKKSLTVTTNWTMTTKLDNGNKVGKERQTGQWRQI